MSAPLGYIMHVGGPFAPAGHCPDGWVLFDEMFGDDGFWEFALRGGTWLLDYGFRGALAIPGLTMHLPKKLKANERSATQQESDHNAIICSARWVIEAINERVENWRVFSGRPRPVTELPKLRQLMLVAAFLF